MDKPFSAHNLVLSPSLKLDPSFFAFSFPTFHHVDNGFSDNIFLSTTDQIGETETEYATAPSTLAPQIITKDAAASITAASNKKNGNGRKRALGKDRHSKICTVLGMRNRRMRLSLDVAPDFFDIQDMLGFDKASKTLRWLITMAKPAIRDLVAASRGSSKSVESSTSGLESGDMISANSDNKGKSTSACPPESGTSPKAKRVCRRLPSKRGAFPTTVARELRLKARERARERTEKKRLLQFSLDHLLYGTVPFGDVREDSRSNLLKSSLDQLIAKVEEDCSRSPNQCRQLGVGGRPNEVAATIFDYNQSTMYNLFHEQWDMEDVQLQTRLWEA